MVSPAPEAFFFPPWVSKSFFVLHIAVKCHLSVAPCPSTLREPPLHASHRCLPLSPEDYFSCCLTDMTKKKNQQLGVNRQQVPFHWLPYLWEGVGRLASGVISPSSHVSTLVGDRSHHFCSPKQYFSLSDPVLLYTLSIIQYCNSFLNYPIINKSLGVR